MLPISVVVPTRNSMSLLPGHLASMRSWLPLVEEVVAVDSHSSDGTLERLQAELRAPNVRVLTHPPGLYQSWNFGIAKCRAKYVYVSTVGDSITAAGLEALHAAAEKFACDLVVSPPRMIDTAGRDVEKRWPIHDCVRTFNLREPVLLQPAQTLLFAAANFRKAIMGSSASNLYRCETLQARPFPTDFGTAGDFGWILQHAPELKFGIVPQVFSTFAFHPKSYAKRDYAVDNFKRKCLATVRRAMESPAGQKVIGERCQLAGSLHEVCAAWEEFLDAREKAEEATRGKFLWFLSLAARSAVRAQNRARRHSLEVQRAALKLIFDGGQSAPPAPEAR